MNLIKKIIALVLLFFMLFSYILPYMARKPYKSGMPCENPEQFQEWYKIYEQTLVEEESREYDLETEVEKKSLEEDKSLEDSCSKEMAFTTSIYKRERIDFFKSSLVRKIKEKEQQKEIDSNDTISSEEKIEIYAVGTETLSLDIQIYLYEKLQDYEIEWFMPYAIMIAWQESQFNQYDVSNDGLDYGLFQFRMRFWDWNRGDIFDPYAQIDVFTENMANRANMGLDVYEMISRHMQSDYGAYNAKYVSDVMSHEPYLRKIEE